MAKRIRLVAYHGLTDARRAALEVVASRDDQAWPARISNKTDLESGHIYWQSADWLISKGLIARSASTEHVALTPAGREVVAKVRAARS